MVDESAALVVADEAGVVLAAGVVDSFEVCATGVVEELEFSTTGVVVALLEATVGIEDAGVVSATLAEVEGAGVVETDTELADVEAAAEADDEPAARPVLLS